MDENPSSNQVSNLKPYHQNRNDKRRNNIARPCIDLKQKEDKEVEEILAERARKGSRPMRRIQMEEPTMLSLMMFSMLIFLSHVL